MELTVTRASCGNGTREALFRHRIIQALCRRYCECCAISGEWDYLLRIAVKDVADDDRFIMRGVLAHPSVANAASNFALRQVKHSTEIAV